MASDTPTMPDTFTGVNHLKFPAKDILKTAEFYTTVFPFKRLNQYDHFTTEHKLFAVMVAHEPTNLIMEIRHVEDQAAKEVGWDPVTWGIKGGKENLEAWGRWLDYKGVKRSKVFVGIKGWVMGCEDPDGKIVRLYCDEEHEWTDHPDQDEYWLGTVTAQD